MWHSVCCCVLLAVLWLWQSVLLESATIFFTLFQSQVKERTGTIEGGAGAVDVPFLLLKTEKKINKLIFNV